MILIPLLGGVGLGFFFGGLAAVVASALPFADVTINTDHGPPMFAHIEHIDRLLGLVAGLIMMGVGASVLWLFYQYVRLLVTTFRRVLRS
jgi:hypothetical protein